MILDIDMLRSFYASYSESVAQAKATVKRPLTYAEKVLFAHLFDPTQLRPYKRGVEYVDFRPNRVAMQDATAQMALLQFMNAGKDKVAVPASVHCDHLIRADVGVEKDLPEACKTNKEWVLTLIHLMPVDSEWWLLALVVRMPWMFSPVSLGNSRCLVSSVFILLVNFRVGLLLRM